jgi:hypothetical protein
MMMVLLIVIANMTDRNLKEEYNQYIKYFIIINIVMFLLIVFNEAITIEKMNQMYKMLLSQGTIGYFAAPIISLVLNGVLPVHIKETFVFWRIKNVLPGTRIFTKLMYKDPRVNVENLINRYGNLPESPTEQNSLWYQIYLKHDKDTRIMELQKSYLLSRDLTSLSIIFLIIFTVTILSIRTLDKSINYYIIYLVLQYLVVKIAANAYGNRFVNNVIAIESNNSEAI